MQLAELPDVVTRRELAALLRMNPRSLEKYATAERKLGRAILPPEVGQRRYLKSDVERWLKQGGLALASAAMKQARLKVIKGR